MATPPPTVEDVERFVKASLASEDVTVSKIGHNTVELVVTDPNADLGYAFGQLSAVYGARVTESSLGSGRGTYIASLPETLGTGTNRNALSTTRSSGATLRSVILSVLVLLLAVIIARFCYTFNWQLIVLDMAKDAIPPTGPV